MNINIKDSIYAENLELFETVCNNARKGPRLWQVFYPGSSECLVPVVDRKRMKRDKVHTSSDICSSKKTEIVPCNKSIKEVQDTFVRDLMLGKSCSVEDFGIARVTPNPCLVLSDNQIKVLATKLSSNANVSTAFSKLVLLPKLYHDKDSEAALDVMNGLLDDQELLAVKEVILPLLQVSEGTNSIVLRILGSREKLSESAIVQLFSTLGKKESPMLEDLEIVSAVTDMMDISSSVQQKSLIGVLENYCNHFSRSIDFGRLLLNVIRNLEPGTKDYFESLELVVLSHRSGLKSVIEKEYNSL